MSFFAQSFDLDMKLLLFYNISTWKKYQNSYKFREEMNLEGILPEKKEET